MAVGAGAGDEVVWFWSRLSKLAWPGFGVNFSEGGLECSGDDATGSLDG